MSSELLSLSQKVSLITGANSGIGRATAILFAQLGSRLVLVARDEKRLQETLAACKAAGKGFCSSDVEPYIYIKADLADPEDIELVMSKTLAHFSRLDILVNNAAYLHWDSIEALESEHFERTLKVNLYAPVLLTKLAVPALTDTKGTVVNVSSIAGVRSIPGVLSYCISKAALDQFTKCCALELAAKGIRVNSVNPGAITTPLLTRSGMSEEESAKFMKNAAPAHPLGRVGEPEEVAAAIAFLASSASSFTTGDLLLVDGGRVVACPR